MGISSKDYHTETGNPVEVRVPVCASEKTPTAEKRRGHGCSPSPNTETLEGLIELHDILQQIVQRSFDAILIVAGIIVLAPIIGDIPGVPTLIALLVILTSVQILAGRSYFWLPQFLLRRSISRQRLQGALNFMPRPAHFADRFLFHRLSFFTGNIFTLIVALAALAVGLVMPLLEFIPFSANLAGIALFTFGAGLVVRDGLFVLISLLLTGAVFGLIIQQITGS